MIRQASIIMAVAGFFIVAIVGTVSGVEPHVCSIRALIGAAFMYVLGRLAGALAVRMMADAAIRRLTTQQREDGRDNR